MKPFFVELLMKKNSSIRKWVCSIELAMPLLVSMVISNLVFELEKFTIWTFPEQN